MKLPRVLSRATHTTIPNKTFGGVALCFLALTAVMICFTSVTTAQTTTGSIYGTVTDTTGASIPAATVTVTDVDTGETHRVQSDGSGNYIFPALSPGNYSASAAMKGFQTEVQKDVVLSANQNVQARFALPAGNVSQTVTVAAATTLVDTRESQLGETVDQKRIADLPLNGRDGYDLVQIVPGVTNYSAPIPTGARVGAQFSVDGLPTNNTAFYLDGAFDTAYYHLSGNLIPDPDSLQEFRLLTADFDAEYGRSPGGVVNIITRSGTNSYHGLLYDYLRNNVLNAKNYFNNEVTPLKQNQFGATFGGPIQRDKAFFFSSYEGLRIRTPAIVSSTLTTLTPAEAQGNFSALPQSQWPVQSNGQPYSCNNQEGVICQNLLDPVAQNLLAFVPLENSTSGRPAEQVAPANTDVDQGMARVDYLLGNHKLSATTFIERGSDVNPTAGGNEVLDYAGATENTEQINAIVNDTWMISDHALNSLRLFYTSNDDDLGTIFGNQHLLAALGSQAAEGGTLITQPYFSITGYWAMGTDEGGPGNIRQESLGAAETFSLVKHNHAIKVGGSYLWNRYSETGEIQANGIFTFTGSTTKNALADFLLGKANSLTQSNSEHHNLHAPDPSLFAQDDWRVTRRLTLDLGLHWEQYPAFKGENNFGTFDAYKQSQVFPTAPLGLLTVGDPGVPDGVMHTSWTKFAPRVGFAYDVFGNGTTAVTGAYGIFYSAVQETFASGLEQQPYQLTVTVNKTPNLVTPWSPSADPFPYALNAQDPKFTSGASLNGLPPNDSMIPYVQEYHLTLQREINTNWSAQVAYVGNVSHRFYVSWDQNAPLYVPGASTSTAGLDARRPYEPTPATYTFSTISLNDPEGYGSYNSLQASLNRRFSHGFSLKASYVWSKDEGVGTLVNQNSLASGWGLSSLDIPQRFVASYMWAPPSIRRWGFIGKQILNNWQLNGITTLSTGSPFTVTSGVDTNLDGNNNDRPNLVGNPNLAGGRSRTARVVEFFNTTAFAQLPAGVPYGDVGSNSLIGPGYVDTDFSAFKMIPLPGERTVEFRGEMFNLFNNVNLDNPTAVMTSPKYGEVAASGSPRIVQFALRFMF